jgi:ribose 5-phosphate isomerase B
MRLAIGADHRGFEQKKMLLDFFSHHASVTCIDVGTETDERTDYPIYAHKVVQLIRQKDVDAAILLCGSGIGMAAAANRFPGIVAGVVWNNDIARIAREHDNVNVLVIPSDYVQNEAVVSLVQAWLGATFLGGRYADRLAMFDE